MATTFRRTFVARRDILRAFPNLRGNRRWRLRSPFDDSYQCIAWAACRIDRKWWPVDHWEFYWPEGLPVLNPPPFPQVWITPIEYMVEGFEAFGYTRCDSRSFEFGYQKVAIYANENGATHAARQRLLGGTWLSKLGVMEDITHERLEDIEGDVASSANTYGRAVQVLKRSWIVALRRADMFRCIANSLRFHAYRVYWRVRETRGTLP